MDGSKILLRRMRDVICVELGFHHSLNEWFIIGAVNNKTKQIPKVLKFVCAIM